METQDTTLYGRVDDILCSHKGSEARPLLATTSTHTAIHELIARTVGLEKAVREIALEVQKLENAEEHEAALLT